MTESDVRVGMRVRSNVPFATVPQGTEGIVDAIDDFGEGHLSAVVAWDLREQPLPAGYKAYDGRPTIASGILRDWFDLKTDLQYLDVVQP